MQHTFVFEPVLQTATWVYCNIETLLEFGFSGEGRSTASLVLAVDLTRPVFAQFEIRVCQYVRTHNFYWYESR